MRNLGQLTAGRGIRCRQCGAGHEWSVYYTRPVPGGVQRVRTCRQCGQRVVTIERERGVGVGKSG